MTAGQRCITAGFVAAAALLAAANVHPRLIAHGPVADRVLIEKTGHRMVLFRAGRVLRVYRVALGRGGLSPKSRAGDNLVPEGRYRIVGRNVASAYHLSLLIGYPTEAQVRAARKVGRDPGGVVMIHGIRNGLGWVGRFHRQVDWTRGCIAVTDWEMDEIGWLVPDGTPVEIRA